MRGLMMDFQLTIPAIVRRAETLFGHKQVVTRRPDRIDRPTHVRGGARPRAGGWRWRCRRSACGPATGSRRSAWASQQHLEAYLAIPSIGAVLHTLNLRLHPDDLSYIVNDAEIAS